MADISNFPVFPQSERSNSSVSAVSGLRSVTGGMTILEYYAGQVLQGLLASGTYQEAALKDAQVRDEIADIVWAIAQSVAESKGVDPKPDLEAAEGA